MKDNLLHRWINKWYFLLIWSNLDLCLIYFQKEAFVAKCFLKLKCLKSTFVALCHCIICLHIKQNVCLSLLAAIAKTQTLSKDTWGACVRSKNKTKPKNLTHSSCSYGLCLMYFVIIRNPSFQFFKKTFWCFSETSSLFRVIGSATLLHLFIYRKLTDHYQHTVNRLNIVYIAITHHKMTQSMTAAHSVHICRPLTSLHCHAEGCPIS